MGYSSKDFFHVAFHMSNEVDQLLHAYRALSSNNDELIRIATSEIKNLLGDSSIINSLFQIIENSDESFIRNQAAISLKTVISSFKENFSIDEKLNIFNTILNFLSNENFEIIQNIFFDIIYTLLSEYTIPILFSFIQNSGLDSLNARLLLSFPDDHIRPFLPVIESLISKILNSDVNGILLGFRIRLYVSPDFFSQIFQKGIEVSINFSNDIKILQKLTSSIIESLKYVDDKSFVLNLYLPLIGEENPSIPRESQILYSSIVTELIKSTPIENTQTMFLILQKYYQLYLFVDENDDIFEFMESFSLNSEFLNLFISKIPELSATEKSFDATLFCLSHCFSANMNESTNFIYVGEIANFLSKAVLNQSKTIRTTAGIAIQTFAKELEENLSEYCPILINSMIESLNIENNEEIIEALTVIFMNGINDEEIIRLFFDKAFSFFILKIENKYDLQRIYPCFVALCATSRTKSHEYFNKIFEINNMILNSTDTDFLCVHEFAIDGLRKLAIMCSENFSDKISDLILYFTQILEQNIDNFDLVDSILMAIGSFISKFSNNFDFTTLIPFLMKLVENNDEQSPHSLSIVCAIMNEYVNKVDLTSKIQTILQSFQLLSNGIFEKSITDEPVLNLLRAITIFVEYINSLSDFNENKSSLLNLILNWTISILNQTDDKFVISEALSIFIQIVDDYLFDPSILFPIFKKILESEYDDDVFSTFSFFLKKLISKGVNFSSLVPSLFEMAKSANQNEIRDFGLQILGQMAESKSGDYIDGNFIKNLVEMSLKSIHDYHSSIGAFVLNQIVTGCSKIPNFVEIFNPIEIMKILLEYIKLDKKNASYLHFADNCVTSFAAIVINVVKNGVPIESYLQIVLERMPARYDPAENYEMMEFFLWLGDQTRFIPVELFLGVLIRLFSKPIDYDSIGKLADKNDMIATLKRKLTLLMSQINDFDCFVNQVCNNDQYKLHYFHKNMDEL